MGKGPRYQNTYELKELGNFYLTPFYMDGVCFHSVEQYFQYCKSTDLLYREEIMSTKSPLACWFIGRKAQLSSNWEEVKENVMYKATLAKFSQNTGLEQLLTGLDMDKLVFCEKDKPDEWDEKNNRIIRRVYDALK